MAKWQRDQGNHAGAVRLPRRYGGAECGTGMAAFEVHCAEVRVALHSIWSGQGQTKQTWWLLCLCRNGDGPSLLGLALGVRSLAPVER